MGVIEKLVIGLWERLPCLETPEPWARRIRLLRDCYMQIPDSSRVNAPV